MCYCAILVTGEKKEVVMLTDEHLADLPDEGSVVCAEVTSVYRCAVVLYW